MQVGIGDEQLRRGGNSKSGEDLGATLEEADTGAEEEAIVTFPQGQVLILSGAKGHGLGFEEQGWQGF